MVTALGPWRRRSDALIPPDMKFDEIVINQWLADDLGAHVG